MFFVSETPPVEGLAYEPEFLSSDEAARLVAAIDAEGWSNQIASRRVQQYGWRYEYHQGRLNDADHLGALPDWAVPIAARLVDEGWMDPPEQIIVNEYLPGQGIGAHIDSRAGFGPVVASISLLAPCIMRFRIKDAQLADEDLTATLDHELWLEPRSLLVLSGPARHTWSHGIAKRKNDRWPDGTLHPRQRRISLTFRTRSIRQPGS